MSSPTPNPPQRLIEYAQRLIDQGHWTSAQTVVSRLPDESPDRERLQALIDTGSANAASAPGEIPASAATPAQTVVSSPTTYVRNLASVILSAPLAAPLASPKPKVAQADMVCPVCRSPLRPVDDQLEIEQFVLCPSCHTVHHADCWEWNGNQCGTINSVGHVGEQPSMLYAEALQAYRDRTAAASKSLVEQVITINPADIASRMTGKGQQAALNRPQDPTTGMWRSLPISIAASTALTVVYSLGFRLMTSFVRWVLGEERFAVTFAIPEIYAIFQSSLVVWIIGGALYGAGHYLFLTRKIDRPYKYARIALSMIGLTMITYLIFTAALIVGFHSPGFLWGAFAGAIWIIPWATLGWSTLSNLGLIVQVYSTSRSVFFVFGLYGFALFVVLFVVVNAGVLLVSLPMIAAGFIVALIPHVLSGQDIINPVVTACAAIGASMGVVAALIRYIKFSARTAGG